MKRWIENIAAAILGLFVSGAIFLTDANQAYQRGYADGRENALKSIVILGEGGPCTVEIATEALSRMVELGVVDWHKACLEASK